MHPDECLGLWTELTGAGNSCPAFVQFPFTVHIHRYELLYISVEDWKESYNMVKNIYITV